jgi:predicted ATP-dependent serine protease
MLLDAATSGETERIVTGGPWDPIWGGGFVPTSITLCGGPPGSGKTTLLLQLLSKLAEMSGKTAYYLSAEQSIGEIKMMAERVGIKNLHQFRVLTSIGAGAEISAELMKKDPPCAIVLDSLTALVGKDAHAGVVIARRFKQYALGQKCPVFLIAHMTKEQDFAGLMTVQHDVDALVTLTPQGDGTREGRAWKNRFGPTHTDYVLQMTEHGFVGKAKKADAIVDDPIEQKAAVVVERYFAQVRAKEMIAEITTAAVAEGEESEDESEEESEDESEAPAPKRKKASKLAAQKEIETDDGQKLVRKSRGSRLIVEEDRSDLPKPPAGSIDIDAPAILAAMPAPKPSTFKSSKRKKGALLDSPTPPAPAPKKHREPRDYCTCGHRRKEHVDGRCAGSGVKLKGGHVCKCRSFELVQRQQSV